MNIRHPYLSLWVMTLLFVPLNMVSCRSRLESVNKATESINSSDLKEPDWIPALSPTISFAGPHKDAYQETFMNPIAFSALQANEFTPWPEGSEFIKRSTNETGELIGYSGQFKKNGWEWATFDKEGKLIWKARGSTASSCNQCHQQMASKFDGVFTPVFFGKGSLSIPINKTK